MKIGLSVGQWREPRRHSLADLVRSAEAMGVDSLWAAEAYGSDALTPLAWFGALTSRMKLCTGIAQMSARTPTATAMAAMTLDALSDGRVVLGLGASGPQVVEGWYGQPFAQPLERTREYVEIVRAALRRDIVRYDGRHFSIPRQGSEVGKALASTMYPLRPDLPLLLAAQGPRQVPGRPEDFQIACPIDVVIGDDVETCADEVRRHLAFYVARMGVPGANPHQQAFVRMGYAAECEAITARAAEGDMAGAAREVTLDMVDSVALVGPAERVADRLAAWEESPVTTLIVAADKPTLATLMEMVVQ